MPDLNGRFNKILIVRLINIYKLLWVPVNQREPGALYLYHYAVTFFKGMRYIGSGKFNF
jgi:hypothetical protein